MKLNSKYHGIKEYKEEDIITFSKGLPGFENLKKFIMFSVEENEIFNILHSLENEEMGLIIVSPFTVKPDYEFKLDNKIIDALNIESEEDVLVFNTVTLNTEVSRITTNLKAPIVINNKNKTAEQVILENDRYSIKHPLFNNN